MVGKRAVAIAVSAAIALAGCATASKDITSSYVSPNQYSSYDCQQLAAEAGRIQTRVVQLGGRLDQAAQNDAGIMAVGLILFWPVLFALGGTKQQEAEYARLKGEYEALEQVSIQKKCAHAVPGTQATTTPAIQTAAPAPVVPPQPSTPAAPIVPPAVLTPPVAAAPMQVVSSAPIGASKYQFAAERWAKEGGCSGAVATINIKSATYETFTIACASGEPRMVRCDDGGACRELK